MTTRPSTTQSALAMASPASSPIREKAASAAARSPGARPRAMASISRGPGAGVPTASANARFSPRTLTLSSTTAPR
ncbi:MAG TPA: hypothetical protein VIH41_00340, partial [Myxococcales bacterium]